MPKTTPRDFFLQLGVLAGLYVSAISLLTLLFHIINLTVYDPLENYFSVYYDPYTSGIRLAIAALIIVFPLYLLLARILNQTYLGDSTKRELALRKWISYLTLFVAGITLVVSLVTLLNSFLGGATTLRFALKILSVVVVAGAAFWYYLYDLRQMAPNPRLNRFMAGLASLAVAAAVIGGFVLMGSPFTQRELRFDSQKVNDLQSLQWQIIEYWRQRGTLPSDLSAIASGLDRGPTPLDPQTGAPYEYVVGGPRAFSLCAVFNQPTPEQRGFGARPEMSSRPVVAADNWQHQTGRTCFERTIDPAAYPPYDNGKLQSSENRD
jgi:hypothetical protein